MLPNAPNIIIYLFLLSKPAVREKNQGSHLESNSGPPTQAAVALATELQLPTATQAISLQL